MRLLLALGFLAALCALFGPLVTYGGGELVVTALKTSTSRGYAEAGFVFYAAAAGLLLCVFRKPWAAVLRALVAATGVVLALVLRSDLRQLVTHAPGPHADGWGMLVILTSLGLEVVANGLVLGRRPRLRKPLAVFRGASVLWRTALAALFWARYRFRPAQALDVLAEPDLQRFSDSKQRRFVFGVSHWLGKRPRGVAGLKANLDQLPVRLEDYQDGGVLRRRLRLTHEGLNALAARTGISVYMVGKHHDGDHVYALIRAELPALGRSCDALSGYPYQDSSRQERELRRAVVDATRIALYRLLAVPDRPGALLLRELEQERVLSREFEP